MFFSISGFIYFGVGVAECNLSLPLYLHDDLRYYEVILLFRTWAIWDRSPKFGVVLLLLTAALGIPAGFLTQEGLSRVTCTSCFLFQSHSSHVSLVTVTPVPQLQNCFLQANRDFLIFIDYALILLWETSESMMCMPSDYS